MKQNFKIGKIFLFIVALFCAFFDCEIGFCNGRSSSQKDTPKGGVISPDLNNYNTPSLPYNAGDTVECKVAEHDEAIRNLKKKLEQQTGEIEKLNTGVNDQQIRSVVNQQVGEITKLKSELRQQIRDVAKFKTEVNNQHAAINQQVEKVVNQQINETAKLKSELERQTNEIAQLKVEIDDQQTANITSQQVNEMIKLKKELEQQVKEVAKLKTEVNNQQTAVNQQAKSVANQQINEAAKLKSELERQTDEITRLKAEVNNPQTKSMLSQQANETTKLKGELEQQVKEVAKLKTEVNNQQTAMNQQFKNMANQQNDVVVKLQTELSEKLEIAQQQLKDMQSQLDEMMTNSQSKMVEPVIKMQTKTAVVEYLPIDISDSIFDSTVVAMKNVDNFNIESKYLNVKVGFDYNFQLKKSEKDDFNKYVILNPKFFGTDNIYFSIFNYHNFLKNRHINSEDFKKNYYTLYAKSNIGGINSIYFGASVGYIPFEDVMDNSYENFKKYMLFASLSTDFDLMLFSNGLHFSNLLTLDFNLLRSDYLVNSNKSNEYIKVKDGILLNYEVGSLTDLFVGVDFGVYTMHRKFRKSIGLTKNTECNLITGIKFEFGSINVSLGNRGVGLGLSMNY